jgi:hypothetical protein
MIGNYTLQWTFMDFIMAKVFGLVKSFSIKFKFIWKFEEKWDEKLKLIFWSSQFWKQYNKSIDIWSKVDFAF